ncbi:hypothetical protein HDU79_010385 [Rhizoclosmatium sp. JEL0117]|nr:hypothetical protein HDU79_010385 [Rhizoclosmatium sp. JEL0117]
MYESIPLLSHETVTATAGTKQSWLSKHKHAILGIFFALTATTALTAYTHYFPPILTSPVFPHVIAAPFTKVVVRTVSLPHYHGETGLLIKTDYNVRYGPEDWIPYPQVLTTVSSNCFEAQAWRSGQSISVHSEVVNGTLFVLVRYPTIYMCDQGWHWIPGRSLVANVTLYLPRERVELESILVVDRDVTSVVWEGPEVVPVERKNPFESKPWTLSETSSKIGRVVVPV